MTEKLKRSNKSFLTDNELIIFDVLFDRSVPVRALEGGEEFSQFFNYKSHNLSVNRLMKKLNKLLSDHLISLYLNLDSMINPKKLVTYVELTKNGGVLWEQERNPLWDYYVIDLSSQEESSWKLSIYSPSLKIAEEFIKVSHKCKIYDLKNPDDLEYSEIDGNDFIFIPWKVFPKLYRIQSTLSDERLKGYDLSANWDLYEKEMKWWRTIDELEALKKKI